MSELSKKRITKFDFIAIAVFIATTILLIIRIHYGIGFDDESFYVSSALRFVNGDAFVADEWHMAQFSFYHLIGFVKLYLKIFGSTEGIILGSRYFMVILRCIVTAILYIELRRYNGKFAAGLIAIDILHIPMTIILNAGYYFFDVIMVELMAVCYLSIIRNYKPYKIVLSGMFITHAILSNPFFIIYPALLLILTVVKVIYSKIKNKPLFGDFDKKLFGIKAWLLLALGFLIVIVPLLIFWLRRTTISEVIRCFPSLFMDLEYNFNSGEQNIFTPLQTVADLITFSLPAFILYILTTAGILIDRKITNRKLNGKKLNESEVVILKRQYACRKLIYLLLEFVTFVIYIFKIKKINDWFDGNMFWMLPLTLLSVSIYLLCENRNKKLFCSFAIPSFVMAISLDISSDTGIRAANIAFEIFNLAGVIFIGNLFDEIREEIDVNKLFKGVACILLSLVIPLQIALQISIIFDYNKSAYEPQVEGGVSVFDTKLTKGPLKGLTTSSNRAGIYYDQLSDLDIIREKNKEDEGPLLVTDNYCYCYIYLNEVEHGSYSSWFPGARWYYDVSPRVYLYYEHHPEKTAEYVYASYYDGSVWLNKVRVDGIVEDLKNHYDYDIIEGKAGYILIRK